MDSKIWFALGVGFWLCTTPAQALEPEVAVVGFGLHSTDFWTAQTALKLQGTRELNPLQQRPSTMAVTHAGALAGQLWIDSKLKGWKRWVFRGVCVGWSAYGIKKNIEAQHKARR